MVKCQRAGLLRPAGHRILAPMPRGRSRELHRRPLSGHAHRVQLFLSLLGLPAQRIDVDLLAGAVRARLAGVAALPGFVSMQASASGPARG